MLFVNETNLSSEAYKDTHVGLDDIELNFQTQNSPSLTKTGKRGRPKKRIEEPGNLNKLDAGLSQGDEARKTWMLAKKLGV